MAWPDGIRGLILLSEAWWAAPCGGGEPPTKVGGLREDILFKSKEYPLALPKKDCQGGWRRHKLHIPRRCPEGTGSLIPLLLLFPPQNFAVGALYFPPDNPLETTKGEACGPLLWKPLRGWTGDGRRGTRHAGVVVPYGGVRKASSTTPASRRIAERLRRRGRGRGGNRRGGHPQRG